jgi:hypothetical protein
MGSGPGTRFWPKAQEYLIFFFFFSNSKGLFGMAPEQNSKEELARACQTP